MARPIPPLPLPSWPLIGALPTVARDGLLATAIAGQKTTGDFFKIKVSALDLNFVAHPEAAERVLKTNRRNYVKGAVYDSFRAITGDGVLTAEGESWRHKRRRLQPAFINRELDRLAEVMARVADDRVARWKAALPGGGSLDVHEEMTGLTLQIVGETLFGLDISAGADESSQAFGEALEFASIQGGGGLRIPEWIPTRSNRRMKKSLATLDATVYGIIDRARASEVEGPPTMLDVLLRLRDEETGEGMSRLELRDEVMTLFLAGHETSALALTWCLHFLAGRPELVEAMAEEAWRVAGDRPVRMEDCADLTLIRAVIDETLRLRGPVWALARNAIEEDEILDYRIPAGANVVVAAFLLHHHPDFWERPHEFDPERFRAGKLPHEFAYLPFSRGPRMCLGITFALIELQIVLAALVRAARIAPTDDMEVHPRARVTLRPDRPIHVRLHWRD